MRFGKRIGRLSHKDVLRGNDRAIRGLALMSNREVPPELLNNVPDANPRKPSVLDAVDIDAIHADKRAALIPLEKDILKACLQALRLHPRVAFVGRFNRGVMQSTYNGRDSYTSFNSVPGFPDIHGMLKGGAAFYIEVKRPKVGKLDDKQSNFLATIKACGGIAGVATCIEEAIALIASPL